MQCCQLGRNFVNWQKFHSFGRWRFRKFRPRNFGLKWPKMAEILILGKNLRNFGQFWPKINNFFVPNFGLFCNSSRNGIKHRHFLGLHLSFLLKKISNIFQSKIFPKISFFLHFEKNCHIKMQ